MEMGNLIKMRPRNTRYILKKGYVSGVILIKNNNLNTGRLIYIKGCMC
jgi:hemolysin activation/secretion protein